MSSYIEIGIIHKTKGFDGTTLVEFLHPISDNTILAFFTSSSGNYSPIVIESLTLKNDLNAEIIWKNYTNKEIAKKLTNTTLYTTDKIAEKHFVIQKSNTTINGFKVINLGIELGTVSNTIENNGLTWLLVATKDKKELMIPMNSPHILNISDENHKIEVSLTDEYLELFSS